jgi:hypothetical protein
MNATRTVWLVAIAGGLALFAFMNLGGTSDFPLDDGWIHQVYARSLWSHGRLDYNPGSAEAGMSSLAWVVLSVPTQIISSAWPVEGAKLTSLAFAVLAAVGAARLIQRLGGQTLTQVLGVGAVLVTPGFAFSAVSGMEPTLTAAALLWGWSELAEPRRTLRAGLWFALAVLARQEAAVVVALSGMVVVWPGSRRTDPVQIEPVEGVPGTPVRPRVGSPNHRLVELVRVGGPAVLALMGWWALTYAATGYPLPNTFYVKAAAGPFASYVWHEVASANGIGVFVVELCSVAMGAWWAVRQKRALVPVALLIASAAAVLAVATSRPMIEPVLFYTQRYFYPFTVLLVPIGTLAIEVVPRARVAAIAALALVLVEVPGLLEARESYQWHCADVHALHTAPALRAAQLVPAGQPIGVEGAGANRYLLPNPIVDLVGLNDHVLAHARNDLPHFACLLAQRNPSWLIIPGDMVLEMQPIFELEPVEPFHVERWSVIGGLEGRTVYLLRAKARAALLAQCLK